jgi:hypothetical protein
MAMGDKGMADMGEMEMPLPENTLPMMTGSGPFGAVGMGGMFTAMKVRKGLARNDYKDPGWYQHPPGTLAREVSGAPPPVSAPDKAAMQAKPGEKVIEVVKPAGSHHGH